MKRIALLFLVVCIAGSLSALAIERGEDVRYNIIYIGDSITAGALHSEKEKSAPPVVTTDILTNKFSNRIINVADFSNCGRSGATTVDFLPSRNRDFKRVEKSIANFKAEAEKTPAKEKYIFSIMLGTNDSASKGPTGSPVSNADYKNNLLTIISRLREMCPESIFVLHRPIWYSPNTYNGARYLVAGLNRATEYITPLEELARENDDIYLGDCKSYELFKREHHRYMFAEKGNAGTFYLHPNEEGAVELAENWAKAIASAVKASAR